MGSQDHERHTRLARFRRIVSVPAVLIGLAISLLSSSPWVLAGAGIGWLPFLAGIVAWRSLLTLALVVVVSALIVLAFAIRGWRRPISGLLISMLPLAVVATVAIASPGSNPRAGSEGARDMTVLSWNVNGALVDPSTIAGEVIDHHADVVVLPSTSEKVLASVAQTLAAQGYTLIHPAGSETAILTTQAYAPAPPDAYGPTAQSEAVAESKTGEPRIIAVHLRIPFLPAGNKAWNREIGWLDGMCRDRAATIIVGDFNATDDNLAGGALAGCADAAAWVGHQYVGSWPTQINPALGIAIDHLFINGKGTSVRSFEVLRDQDDSGARHRPILVDVEVCESDAEECRE